MLEFIKKAIGFGSTDSAGDNVKSEVRVELLASVLLLEAAHSDYECTEVELEHVVKTIKEIYHLSDDVVAELLELAHTQRKQEADMYHFTLLVNKNMSRQEKLTLLEGVWRIILADGKIDKYEENYARRITDLLRLEHKDFISAKLKVKSETSG